jgi:hypothetical protein
MSETKYAIFTVFFADSAGALDVVGSGAFDTVEAGVSVAFEAGDWHPASTPAKTNDNTRMTDSTFFIVINPPRYYFTN